MEVVGNYIKGVFSSDFQPCSHHQTSLFSRFKDILKSVSEDTYQYLFQGVIAINALHCRAPRVTSQISL